MWVNFLSLNRMRAHHVRIRFSTRSCHKKSTIFLKRNFIISLFHGDGHSRNIVEGKTFSIIFRNFSNNFWTFCDIFRTQFRIEFWRSETRPGGRRWTRRTEVRLSRQRGQRCRRRRRRWGRRQPQERLAEHGRKGRERRWRCKAGMQTLVQRCRSEAEITLANITNAQITFQHYFICLRLFALDYLAIILLKLLLNSLFLSPCCN